MPSFSFHTSVMMTCCVGMLGRGYLSPWPRLTSISASFEDQDDCDNAFYELHRERNQTLLQFAHVARAVCLKHDAYGYPLPDQTKGMIFLRQAKIPGHLEDHIMAKTNGSSNFSDLFEAIQILAQRSMSQVSSSFPSYDDEWDDSTNVTEYDDIDDHNTDCNDGYCDAYEELEDHEGEWIDMSGMPEDVTFEEPELARMLENLQKSQKGSSKGLRRDKKGWSKGETRDVLKLSIKEAGKGRSSWKLQASPIEAAKRTSQQRLEKPAGSWNEQRSWSPTGGSGG